jgi:pimeloyl-ACP methyl ester carboxylesterase
LNFDHTVRWARHCIQTDREAIVLAESFSGPVAVALVGAGLIKPKCLILCATFARPPRPHLLKLAPWLPLSHLLRLPLPGCLLKHWIEGGRRSTLLLGAMWKRVRVKVCPHVLAHRLRLTGRIDVRPCLKHISVPCLYIQATGDRTVPETCAADFRAELSNVSILRIKGPHFILQAYPLTCLEAIGTFVRQVNG